MALIIKKVMWGDKKKLWKCPLIRRDAWNNSKIKTSPWMTSHWQGNEPIINISLLPTVLVILRHQTLFFSLFYRVEISGISQIKDVPTRTDYRPIILERAVKRFKNFIWYIPAKFSVLYNFMEKNRFWHLKITRTVPI